LSGTIPSSLGKLFNLLYLDVSENKYSGFIPSEFEKLRSLVFLDMSNNNLKGSIAANLRRMTSLQQLFLEHNHLTGSISAWFDDNNDDTTTSSISLVNIDLSDNKLSGNIPGELFLLPEVQTVSLTKNCFTGTLPSSMCKAVKMTVLSMDGLGTADGCKHTSSIPFTNVLLGKTLQGSIPTCLMLLRNITVLSLSANGFTGTLGELKEPSSLVNLSVSHNHISGTIPSSVASHNFQSLDLSYNKIHGYADNVGSDIAYGCNTSLILAVNRLSGDLKDFSSITFYTLDVLRGNIFGCDNSVPNDESSDTYGCGSEEFNQALISLCVALGLFLLMAACTYYTLGKYTTITVGNNLCLQNIVLILEYYKSISVLDKSKFYNLQSLVDSVRYIIKSVWVICVSIIICTVPIYILKALDYGDPNPTYATHSKAYMWEITTAYITGELPAGLLLFVWFGSAFVFVVLMGLRFTTSRNATNKGMLNYSNSTNRFNETSYISYLAFGFMLLINICVVGLINGVYVYLTLLELDVWLHGLIQICFAFVKYIWNFVVVPAIIFSPLPISPYRSWLKLFVNMLNSVFLPCIASSFTSTSCFQVLCSHY
jgi:hypothetical protein